VATTTKERILNVTADLFRQFGYTGTGLKQIVADANAPFGSLYHHFPGGKEQLGVEVIARSGQMYYALFEAVFDDAPDAVTGVSDFFAGAAEVLRATEYADACPIATVALEVASRSEPLREATADVFESWLTGVTGRFEKFGIPGGQARALAMLLICVLEGAFILSRASRTTEALEVAGAAATAAVAAALPAATPPVEADGRQHR
jgi:AcrR family transcriptional regulator